VPAARASRSLAMGHLCDGRFDQAEREIDKAIAALARIDGERPSDIALGAHAARDRIAYCRDDTVATLERGAATYELTVQVGNRTIQTATAANLAQAHLVRGEYEAAQHWVEKSLEVALATGNVGATRSASAIGLLVGLQVGEAGPITARYLELIEQSPTVNVEPLTSTFVIEALLAADSFEHAERLAEAVYRSAGGRLREAVSALSLGEVRLRKGGPRQNEAQEWFERARRIADDIGVGSIAANAMLGLGDLAVARGDASVANGLYEDALAIHRRLGLGYYASRVERAIAASSVDAQASA
jgi:tetratricopeptide (TPR) repeat protein